MKSLIQARKAAGLSQRGLAAKAQIAYRSVQLIESGQHNPSLDTLDRIAEAIGLDGQSFQQYVEDYFRYLPDSVHQASRRIVVDGEASWKIHVLNLVDAFRRTHDLHLIMEPPASHAPMKIRALLTSIVEHLCDEQRLVAPEWTMGVGALPDPWFVAEIENLKPMALVESPIHFRKRNIFVLASILDRA